MSHNNHDNADVEEPRCNIHYKFVIFLFVLFVLYMFLKNEIDNATKIILLGSLFVVLYFDYNSSDTTECTDKEGFISTDGSNSDSDKEPKTNRQIKIDELNRNREFEGRFFVKCHGCGRDRILEDSRDIDRMMKQRSRRYGPCRDVKHRSMSFYNENYIDSSKIFCYNCLIDQDDKRREAEPNYGDPESSYVYWPRFEDPVNGPPYV
jgi:hypothetical protein